MIVSPYYKHKLGAKAYFGKLGEFVCSQKEAHSFECLQKAKDWISNNIHKECGNDILYEEIF